MTAAVFCRSSLFSGVSSNSVVSKNFGSSDDPGTRQRNRSRSLPPLVGSTQQPTLLVLRLRGATQKASAPERYERSVLYVSAFDEVNDRFPLEDVATAHAEVVFALYEDSLAHHRPD